MDVNINADVAVDMDIAPDLAVSTDWDGFVKIPSSW